MSIYTASIAQMLSKRRHHKALGSGLCRKAYYSPRHQVVFKIDQESYEGMSRQMRQEIEKAKSLTEEEKEIFPIIAVEVYKGRTVMIMKRATLYRDHSFNCDWYESRDEITRTLTCYCAVNKLVVDNLEQVVDFIINHRVQDVHRNNIGVVGTKLVVIDMGY